jgi:hypothetical protein
MTKPGKTRNSQPRTPQHIDKIVPKVDEEQQPSASGRWTVVHRTRLPHRVGLPLSSGGCGDMIER